MLVSAIDGGLTIGVLQAIMGNITFFRIRIHKDRWRKEKRKKKEKNKNKDKEKKEIKRVLALIPSKKTYILTLISSKKTLE